MNKNIRGIFFDLYGTLFIFKDIEKSWAAWAIKYYELIKGKTNMSFEDFSKSAEGIMDRKVIKDIESGLTTYETRIKDHCSGLSISLTRPEIKRIADETPLAWQKYASIPEDAVKTLKTLKKYKILALITIYDHAPHVRRTLSSFDLEKYFDCIVISDEVGCVKPDKRIFEIALEKTNLKPGEVLFVGDNPKDDIGGAQNAGITPILILYDIMSGYKETYNLEKDFTIPDVQTIHSLKELMAYI